MHYIPYNGKALPFIFDYYVIKTIASKLKIKFSDFESVITDFDNLESALFEALKRGAKKTEGEFTLIQSEVSEILCADGAFADVLKAFNSDITVMFKPSESADAKKN